MKKIFNVVIMCALLCACTKNLEIVDPYSSGVCVGEILLGSISGKVSVAVETEGNWRIESDQPWLKTDVSGRTGDGAFTVYYESNQSDVHVIRQARVAKLAIRIEDKEKTDTLVFVQRGLMPVKSTYKVQNDPALTLEYHLPQEQTLTLLCCSNDDAASVDALIEQHNPDVTVTGEKILFKEGKGLVNDEGIGVITDQESLEDVKSDAIRVAGCNYKGMTEEEKYDAFRSLINRTYNAGPDAGDNWIYAGQMYHLSSMMMGYEATPEWYPDSTSNEKFFADIFAWQNNLYDCVWMYSQDYVATYTDPELGAYSADYVYVSPSVFSRIESVELLDIEGLSHKPIKVTFKY